MRFTLIFETDTLPLYVGDFKSIDEAFGAAEGLVAYFRSKGYSSLTQYCIREKI